MRRTRRLPRRRRQGLHRVAGRPARRRAAGKVEVIEFFWYGCPHCNEFEPYLEAWAKKQGPDVVFKRVPVAFRDDFIPHSKMYHALDALGVAEKLTPAVFNEIHVEEELSADAAGAGRLPGDAGRRQEEVHGRVQLVLDAKRACSATPS